MSNYYTKTGDDVMDLEDLRIYNLCPGCECEVEISDFWDILGRNNLNLYRARVYCKECAKLVRNSRRAIDLN